MFKIKVKSKLFSIENKLVANHNEVKSYLTKVKSLRCLFDNSQNEISMLRITDCDSNKAIEYPISKIAGNSKPFKVGRKSRR